MTTVKTVAYVTPEIAKADTAQHRLYQAVTNTAEAPRLRLCCQQHGGIAAPQARQSA